jgi:hypothetical protein
LFPTGFSDVEKPVGNVDNSLQCYYFSQLCHSPENQLFQIEVKYRDQKATIFRQIPFGKIANSKNL